LAQSSFPQPSSTIAPPANGKVSDHPWQLNTSEGKPSEALDPEFLAETRFASPSDYAADDFAEVYHDQADQFTPTFRPSTPPPTKGLPPTQVPPPAPSPSSPPSATTLSELADLERALQQKQWKQADRLTLTLMLKTAGAEAKGWLDDEIIRQLPCTTLHEIDRLWRRYSNGKFGFSAQWQVFAKLVQSLPYLQSGPRSRASQQPLFNPDAPRSAELEHQKMLKFCKEVGWWQVGEFHKYYNQLTFHKYHPQPALALSKADVPRGQLPAFWYWEIPWWKALQLGGIGPGRGGCCVDWQTLAAFMQRLQDCEVGTSVSKSGS
jgi:hypothetical protein